MNGLALVAAAGPIMNVLFAIVLTAVSTATIHVFLPLAEFLANAARLSIYLAIFNLIPVPPLDGSKLLLAARIPISIYNELARFGFVLLIVALSSTSLGPWISMSTDRITFLLFRLFRA